LNAVIGLNRKTAAVTAASQQYMSRPDPGHENAEE
jgi:hypothetical protein